MDKGQQFMQSSTIAVLNDDSFKKLYLLNQVLLNPNVTINDVAHIDFLYRDAEIIYADFMKKLKKIEQTIRVIETRYQLSKNHRCFKLLKVLSDEGYIDSIFRVFVSEAEFYFKFDVLNWFKAIQERQDLSRRFVDAINEFLEPETSSLVKSNFNNFDKAFFSSYKALELVLIKIFPRIRSYLRYSFLADKYVAVRFLDLLKNCNNPRSARIMESYFRNPSYNAYFLVMAEITLIDYDIAGKSVEKNLNKLLRASYKTGLDFFFIKILDEILDTSSLKGNLRAIFVDGFEQAMLGRDYFVFDLPEDCDCFLEFVKMSQKFFPTSPQRAKILRKLKKANFNFLKATKFSRKLMHTEHVGRLCADLQIDNLATFVEIDDNFRTFQRNKGIAGNVFDDIEDYMFDQKYGIGYVGEKRLHLLMELIRKLGSAFFGLSSKSKFRLMNFCILAGLFKTTEYLGLKPKS